MREASDDIDPLERLRAFVSEADNGFNTRLPPERDLCRRLDISRTELRKALAVLEAEGRIWRHVGRGTFLGARPVLDLADAAYLGELASPARVMEARLAIEPPLARLAALHGVKSDFERVAKLCQRCRKAREWRTYEASDDALHHAIAIATHNKVLVNLFERLNTVRRATVWGQLRSTRLPPSNHTSFAQHDAIAAAISGRDAEGAETAMRVHLMSVRDRLLAVPAA
ncbi:MAG: FCD domain-containing protein [Pseudomonadota bacterium]